MKNKRRNFVWLWIAVPTAILVTFALVCYISHPIFLSTPRVSHISDEYSAIDFKAINPLSVPATYVVCYGTLSCGIFPYTADCVSPGSNSDILVAELTDLLPDTDYHLICKAILEGRSLSIKSDTVFFRTLSYPSESADTSSY